MAERVAVIGLGVTGQSIVRYFKHSGTVSEVVVLDTRSPDEDLSRKYAHVDIRWGSSVFPKERFDKIVVSPGLSMESCLMKSAIASGAPVLSDIDLFFELVQAPVLGITGTNGKSTVTSLVGHMLQCVGQNVGVGGNLGEAALDLMVKRGNDKTAFGQKLLDLDGNHQKVATSRIEIDQARLLTLKAAWMMDELGVKAARSEIAQIKVVAPNVAQNVLDRAIQMHGAAGVSDDFPLAAMWAHNRTLRLADGPDEVHLRTVARLERRRCST